MTPSTARIDLPMGVRVPAYARRLTTTLLELWGVRDDDALAACSVVVSELVTNALRHSGPREHVELQVSRSGDLVRIALADGSAVVPRPREAGPDDESGRGLSIVERLSVRWGVEDHGDGKRVYADVPLAPVEG